MAGLLDSLSDPNGADPAAGLLSFLASLQKNAPPSQTGPMPSDVAQYSQPAMASAPVFAGSPVAAPAQNAQASPLDTAQYPFGPVGAPSQANAQMTGPVPAVSAPPVASQPAAQPSAAGPGIGSNLMTGYENLRHGGGLIGSVVAALTGQRNDPYGIAQQQQAQAANLTARALVAKGVDPAVARAAVQPGNTEFLKTLIAQTFGPSKRTFQHYKDANGNEIAGVFDPDASDAQSSFTPISAPPSSPSAPTTIEELRAKDPALAAQAEAVHEGRLPFPTASRVNPQQQRLRDVVATIWPDFDANVSRTRQKFQAEYGSTTPNSVGGQKILMGTALGHLGELAESATKMNNSSGFGLAPVGHFINRVENTTTTNSANAVALEDKAAKFSGEVGKLYSGSQGGGVQEREETRSRFSPNNTPQEMAAALEASRDLILSKQRALEAQAESIYGPEGAQKFDFVGPEGRAALERIEKAIVKLRGGNPEGGATPAKTSKPAVVIQNGHTYNLQPDGSYK
jgi:hypothetical protein